MSSSMPMASSASRDSDLKRKLSTADFLRIDTGGNARDDGGFLSLDQGNRPAVEAESSSSATLTAEIKLMDRERQHKRTVDDVWREIVAGKRSEKQPKEEMMTLEDFLAKAEEKEAEATRSVVEVKEEGLSGGIYSYESGFGVIGAGLDVGGIGRGIGRRSVSLLEPLDKVQQQRQKRMIKNRESAARSRERKQAFQVELESVVVRLEEEQAQLLKEKVERRKKRLKQLIENVIPVSEKQRPRRLRKVRSMQW